MADLPPDPSNFGQWFVWGGMALGGAIAALFGFKGWNKPASAKAEHEMLIHGQAQITDMEPLRDLVKQTDLLIIKLMAATIAVDGHSARAAEVVEGLDRTSAALERLAVIATAWIEQQRLNEEIDAEVKARLDDAVEERLRELERKGGGRTRPT